MHQDSDAAEPAGLIRQARDAKQRDRLRAVELALLEPDAFEEDTDGLELIPVQGDETVEGPRLPDFYGLTKREAKAAVVRLGLHWDPRGAGRVVNQEPAPGTLLQEVRLCKLEFSGG